MSRQEAAEQYQEALRRGKKTYKSRILHGLYPYPQVLDEILDDSMNAGVTDVGLIEAPTACITGTRTQGRRDAFSADFMPLMPESSEFAAKWISLCEAHLGDEGIRDPIRCCEYLGRFYVQEGNKRVSVLKSYGAPTVPAYVTRIVPKWSDEPEIRAYYEFMDSYRLTGLYQLLFSRAGSFAKLQAALGHEPGHEWTDAERRSFLSGWSYFEAAFEKQGGAQPGLTAADALLVWLKLNPFDALKTLSAAELQKSLAAVWSDVRVSARGAALQTESQSEKEEPNVLSRLVQTVFPTRLRLAFVSDHLPEESDWTHAHDLGRQYVEAVLGERVEAKTYYGARDDMSAVMEAAVSDGAQVVFGVTPSLIGACRSCAAAHPEVRVLGCAISMPYTGLRTYYGRIYEGKFITGALAGALSRSDEIGYVASNPIFGVPASINAFAMGAQLTNPKARIRLRWSCVDELAFEHLAESGVDLVSNRDVPTPDRMCEPWGLCAVGPEGCRALASPYWHWGKVYEKLLRSILSGSWDSLNAGEGRAVNYWWGMQSGAVGVLVSEELPAGVRQLAELLKRGVTDGSILPFERAIRSRDGTPRSDGSHLFTPEELLRMDWLCENVEGEIPAYCDLLPRSRTLARLQGVYRDDIAPEKEDVIL